MYAQEYFDKSKNNGLTLVLRKKGVKTILN